MSPEEIESILKKKEWYELGIWFEFLATKMDCRDCIQACLDNNKIPDCSKCVPSKNLINKSRKLLEKGANNNGKTN